MAKATFQPKWWTEKHGSQWANLKEALERDWEQTKKDLHLGGHELHQDVGDTLKQAAGSEPIPPKPSFTWDEVEQPLMYGVGAREQFGAEHVAWDDKLESKLRTDWESDHPSNFDRKWDEIKSVVRHGYNRARQ